MQPAFITALTVVTVAGCASGGTEKFKRGHSAYASGNLQEAFRQYSAAVRAEPKNRKFRDAKERVGAELAEKSAAEAQGREAAGQWNEASTAWAQAAEAMPDTKDYAVRRDLSAERAKDLDDLKWFEAAKTVADRYPGNEAAEEALSQAREKAFQYHVGLAEDLLAAGRGKEALRNLEIAKEIDPDTPGLRVDTLTKAEALALTEQGDELSENGEHIAAYEKYQAAYAKIALPEIKTKLANSKKKAGQILALLEQARAQNKRKRYGRAVALYERALKMGGVPESVEREVAQARTALVKQDVAAADRYSAKGSLRYAERAIQRGLVHAKLDKKVSDLVKVGLKTARNGQPGKALETFERSGLPEESPLYDATQNFAVASAKIVFARARRYAKRDKPKALGLLGDLEPFEDDLPQIAELRRSLRSGSFLELLAEAKRAGQKKRDGEAASLLMAALNASSGAETIRGTVKVGTDALKIGRFADAEKAFRDSLAAAPRSKLAQSALEIAQARRKQAESEAVALLKSGKGNDLQATELLEAGLALDPGSATAKAGADALMARLRKKGLSDAQAGTLIGYANRLGATPGVAKTEVADGADMLAKGDLSGAAGAFSKALDAAPGSALAKLAKQMAEARAVASLKGEAQAATTGDVDAAEALAELLQKNPNDPDGRRQLQALFGKAKAFAASQNDAEAARFLGLAAIAVSPSPELNKALDKGEAAMKVSNVAAAERAYAEAKGIDANNPVAKEGYAIAKGARLAALAGALTAAKSGGDTKAVEKQLVTSFEIDPQSPEAKKAVAELLAEAEKQAAAGGVARAALLLDAANATTKPAALQAAVRGANASLKASRFAAAEAAYRKALASGTSAVANTGQKIAMSGAASNLSVAVQGLQTGKDLTRGAAAARALLKQDANSAPARAAVKASLARAERAAADGDDGQATRELNAVASALGETALVGSAIAMLSKGKYAEAETGFKAASKSEVARTGERIARSRKLFSLKVGLSGAGVSAAMSIRRLLRADPNNPEAKKAFQALLDKAVSSAKAGNDAQAAEILNQASVAAASPRPLDRAIRNATAQLKEKRYAQAQLGFRAAQQINADSKVVLTGLSIARSSRTRFEGEKIKALSGATDPRPHASALADSLRVDPKSPAVAQGLKVLLGRAESSANSGKDADVARALEGAAVLENRSAGQIQAVAEGAAQLVKGTFASARKTFMQANDGIRDNSSVSVVAQRGATLARTRQLATLKSEYQSAARAKDILRQSDIVQQILEIDPRDRTALSAKKRLVVSVQKARLEAARTQKAQGKLGVAHLYLVRSLALNAGDKAARSELTDIEEKLKKSSDLILVVEPIQRSTALGTKPCKGIDSILREELQTTLSKDGSLGTYILSPAWTQIYENKEKRAPNVNGGLRIRIDRCRVSSSNGEITTAWDILSPRRGGEIAKGKLTTKLPSGLIPREEQDAAGMAARKKMAKRVATDLIGKLEEARSEINAWLVSRAEHGMKIDDPEMVAEAYARIRQKNPRSLDPERIIPIEKYLAEKFR